MSKKWRCFHCDEVFTSHCCALAHFGDTEMAEAACQIKGHEHHLVGYIRDLEFQLSGYRAETDAITSAWHSRNAEHAQELIRAEEAGYNKGVRDARKPEEVAGEVSGIEGSV